MGDMGKPVGATLAAGILALGTVLAAFNPNFTAILSFNPNFTAILGF